MNPTAFYILSAVAVISTALSITRRELVHAIVYLIQSFFSIALLFYMMGAPLLAAVEVLVYAGAIMVLFLFIVMMLHMGGLERKKVSTLKAWGPAGAICAVLLFCTNMLIVSSPEAVPAVSGFYVTPRVFGQALFTKYALAVEIVSLLLLFALVGSLYLGRRD